MGQWTWLHAVFPLADIELAQPPIDAKVANVIVRAVRELPTEAGVRRFEVRVAPHNVAPFRGGPWLRRFTEAELVEPGASLFEFRALLAAHIAALQNLRQKKT